MSFLSGWVTETGIKLDMVVRKVIIDITRDIMLMTPVDTGHARSHYFWGVVRVGTIDPTKSKNGAPSITRALEFASELKAGGVVYITNNLPYIMRLEFGSSTQAPAGMARITVERFQQILDGAVNVISRKEWFATFRGKK